MEALQDFIESDVKFGEIGTRDERLSMENVVLAGREGRVRFVHFPTDATSEFLLHAREFKASSSNAKIAATGGGAFKFEDKFQQVCNINMTFVMLKAEMKFIFETLVTMFKCLLLTESWYSRSTPALYTI